MIAFCKTDLGKEESDAAAEVIKNGWVVLGPKSQEFEEKFAEYVGAKHAVFVDSGTAALFLAMRYQRNLISDAVEAHAILPSLTFVATAESAVHAGFQVTFADVDFETLCMQVPESFGWRDLRAPVHLCGNHAGEGDVIDSAHRIEKGDMVGVKSIWCYSFYATKNMTTVTGGMVCTNDPEVSKWLKLARDHGLSLGTKERYTEKYKQYDVDFVGWRVKGDDFRAAVGLEQLKKLPRLTERRNELVERYNRAFHRKHTGNHLYPILVKERPHFVEHLFNEGIQTAVHFRPLHTMKAYENCDRDNLANTTYIGERIVSLPLYPQLTNEEQDYIIGKVLETRSLI